MTFTPGSDDDRTDTYEAQIKLQEDDVSTEQEFNEAQKGLQDANTWFQRTLGIYGALTDKVAPTVTSTINSIFEFNNEDTKIGLDKYSSGKVVQTEDGPLYRADGISSVFQMVDDQEPAPKVRKTPSPAEKELRINRWVNDLAFTVDKVKRDGTVVPTHISKLQPKGSGYEMLGKAKAEWNQWAKRTGFIRELSDKKMTAFVEHLVGKDKFYDLFWELPNEKRFRKGSRHGPNNVRILLDNRMKTMKDTSEGILKRLLPNPTVDSLLVFDYDIPRNNNQSIVVNTSPRDLMLKRVDGTVVGRLGDYHDVLYAPFEELKEKLSTNINERTGRPYITIQLPDGSPLPESDIKAQISVWRSGIMRDKIQFIIDEAPTLKGLTKKQKWQYQGSAIQEDMVNFLDEYKFLKPGKGFREKLNKEGWNRKYGGIKTDKEKTEGIFLTKTQERQLRRSKLRQGSLFRSMFIDIFGEDRDID